MSKKTVQELEQPKSNYWRLLVVFVFVFLAIGLLYGFSQQETNLQQELTNTSPKDSTDNQTLINSETLTMSHPVAVMIDNHFETWEQQYGLSEALVVYNVPVEGGTTRFMALFDVSTFINIIGPVRSVRPYFINWALEYNALLAHVGGSPEALQDIVRFEVHDLNEMTASGPLYFERIPKFPEPHNTFTGSKALQLALGDNELPMNGQDNFLPFVFSEEDALLDDPLERITIDYSARRTYDVDYIWQQDKGVYYRYRVDEVQFDALNDHPLEIRNIIIQHVPAEEVLDDKLRIALEVIGEGDADFIINGKRIIGSWYKDTPRSQTRYIDESGNEIEFVPGQIWIEVVPGGYEVEFE